VQEQYKIERKGSRIVEHSQLYWFTLPQGLRQVAFAPQAKKISLNLINCSITNNYTILTPCKNQTPTEMSTYSP